MLETGIKRARSLALMTLVALLALGGSLAVVQAAGAASPQLLAPANGKVLARGSRPTFKVKDLDPNSRQYSVYMTVSRSKRVDRKGDLKQTRPGTFTSMNRSGRYGFRYTPPAYTFDTWFMQAPGKYYWQAYHIDCNVAGCHVQSRIRSFVVR